MADSKLLEQRSPSSRSIVSVVAHAPEAKAVIITGDFTGWSEEGIPLVKGRHGDWEITLKLAPGEHQYRLRVDGRWQDHPEARDRIPNPFGTENCVLKVKG
jgi:1,4-alpha-glucan branching enzyme